MSGDATIVSSGALTLATVNTNVGTFGDSSDVAVITVNAKGLVTAVTTASITAPAGALTGTTLKSTIVTSSLTTVGTIGTGTWQGTPIGIAYGGTGQTTASAGFNALAPATATGGLIVGTGTNTYGNVAIGSTGQVLTVVGGTAAWAATAATATWNKQTEVLSSTDIGNQYYDLAFVALTNSISFLVQGSGSQLEGASYDYTVSYTGGVGGVTRITFVNGLATGGVSALVSGDVIQIQYQH
jgi:hypothetical protein